MPPIAALVMAVCLFWSAGPVAAGVGVRLELEHRDLLQYEPMLAYVTIHNDSSSTLVVDSDLQITDAAGVFIVTDIDGKPANSLQTGSFLPDLRILPDARERFIVDPSVWREMSRPGRYIVRCDITRGRSVYESNRVLVDVVEGIELIRVSRPLPGYSDALRTYSLRYWGRGGKEYLFLRVTDETDHAAFPTIGLGPVVRFVAPRIRVDLSGDVEVVHQAAGDRFVRTVFHSERDALRFVDRSRVQRDGSPYPMRAESSDARREAGQGGSRGALGAFWGWLRGK
jgi:hypothetical protein